MKNRYKFLVLLLIFLYPVSVFAIPSLGVAPNSGGYYEGDPGVEYLEWFVDPENFVPVGSMTNGMDNDSFIIKWDWEGELTVWFGSNDGLSGWEKENVEVYIATTSIYGDDFVFAEKDFYAVSDDQDEVPDYYKKASTYKLPYYGINLGTVSSGDWVLAPEYMSPSGDDTSPDISPFREESKEFYFYTGSFSFPQYEIGDWIFALADYDDNGVFDTGDKFSPPTTSTRIPEPANMLLLGTGLIVMAGLGRKRFFKK